MAHFNLDLDLDKSQAVGQVVRARVGDVESCVIAATIYDHGSEVDLAGMGARFCMLKPDRTVIEDDGCEVDGSTVTHTLGSQATAAAGVAELAYFEILEGSTVIDSTQSFRLVIEPDAEGSGTGPSEDYISRVDAAVEASNDAAEAATGAAQSANAAAKAANDAAEGAAQAAQSANAAAEAASAAAEAARGNVLKGTLGPDPLLSADDAYATTPRRLTVYGETRQNLWSNPATSTVSGITVTSNADGSITLSGTSTSDNIFNGYKQRYVLRPGSTYTLSVDGTLPSGTAFRVEPRDADDTIITGFILEVKGEAKTATATLPSGTAYVNCIFYSIAPVGTTISGTYRIMLNEGSTPQPWCPPGLNSVDELSLVTAGKNLADIDDVVDSTVINHPYDLITYSCPMLHRGTYTVSADVKSTLEPFGLDVTVGNNTPSVYITSTGDIKNNGRVSLSFTLEAKHTRYKNVYFRFCRYDSSHTYTYSAKNIQLELGSTATDYEPPSIVTTPVDLDGNSLRSLPDGTCDELTVDATGAVTLVQRVCAVEYEASDFNDSTVKYAEAVLTKRYAGGVDFSANRQLSDFAPIGNADAAPGHPLVGAYTSYSDGILRGGTGNAEASPSAQSTAFKAMLGSQTWHHLYELATPQTIELPPVTLPTLPAPTVNVFADAESSGTGYAMGPDVGMEYERDVTVAFDKLQAQVSTLNVLEATNG